MCTAENNKLFCVLFYQVSSFKNSCVITEKCQVHTIYMWHSWREILKNSFREISSGVWDSPIDLISEQKELKKNNINYRSRLYEEKNNAL